MWLSVYDVRFCYAQIFFIPYPAYKYQMIITIEKTQFAAPNNQKQSVKEECYMREVTDHFKIKQLVGWKVLKTSKQALHSSDIASIVKTQRSWLNLLATLSSIGNKDG